MFADMLQAEKIGREEEAQAWVDFLATVVVAMRARKCPPETILNVVRNTLE